MTLYVKTSTALPPASHSSTGPIETHNIEHIKVNNKSEEIQIEEAPNVEGKQILDDDGTGFDYPVVTKKEAESEITHLNIEHLRQKCMHLTKLLNLNKPPSKPTTYEQYQDDYRPVYVTTQKPTVKPTYAPVTRPSSFYVTVPPGNNRISIPAASAIRYIRLEPVILQKTILSNGRTVYYWHKSLPTAVEYPDKNENIGRDEPQQGNYNYGYNPFYNYFYNPNLYIPPTSNYYSPFYPNVAPVKPTETTTEQTTTTTEESSFSYGLSHLIPFYGSGGDSPSTTTEVPTTTPPKPDDLLYGQQLKFMVPYPYEENIRQNWGYNPYNNYNYVPQVVPQSSNNYRVPYAPQMQIVKAVVVPKVEAKSDEKDEEITK